MQTMMTSRPVHPGLIRRIPMRHTAEIRTHHGWWFHYAVHRLHGIFIPESSVTVHRSLSRAQRAVRRWEAKDAHASHVVQAHR